MTEPEAAQLVAILAASYPGWAPTRETVLAWVSHLTDLDADTAAVVARDLVAVEPRWPTIAGFRRAYAAHLGWLSPSPSEAWRQVQDAIRTGSRRWSHPAVEEAVTTIGWRSLAMSENPDTIRAQFRRAYEDAATAADTDTLRAMRAPADVAGELVAPVRKLAPVAALPERGPLPADLLESMRAQVEGEAPCPG